MQAESDKWRERRRQGTDHAGVGCTTAMKIVDARITPCTQRLSDPSWKFARATVPQLEGWRAACSPTSDGHEGSGYAHAIPAITTQGAARRPRWRSWRRCWSAAASTTWPRMMEEIDATLAYNAERQGRASTWRCTTCWRAGWACRCTCCSAASCATASRSRASCRSSRRRRWRPRPPSSPTEGYRAAQAQAVRRHRARRRAHRRRARGRRPGRGADAGPEPVVRRQADDRGVREDGALRHRADRAAGAGRRLGRAGAADAHAAGGRSRPTRARRPCTTCSGWCAERVVDVINLKVTKLGGLRRLHAGGAHLRGRRRRLPRRRGVRPGAAAGDEPAGGQRREALPFACELSEHLHLLDDPFTPLPVEHGSIALPDRPGCGVELPGD